METVNYIAVILQLIYSKCVFYNNYKCSLYNHNVIVHHTLDFDCKIVSLLCATVDAQSIAVVFH